MLILFHILFATQKLGPFRALFFTFCYVECPRQHHLGRAHWRTPQGKGSKRARHEFSINFSVARKLNGDRLDYQTSWKRLKIRTRFCFGFIAAASVLFFSSSFHESDQRSDNSRYFRPNKGPAMRAIKKSVSVLFRRIILEKEQQSGNSSVPKSMPCWRWAKFVDAENDAKRRVNFDSARFRMMTGPEDDSRRWSIKHLILSLATAR